MTPPRSNRLLIDADEFKTDVEQAMRAAKQRIWVQAMTFECDSAGEWLLNCMRAAGVESKILCIDAYSLMNVNDGWAFGGRYWRSPKYRAEVNATRAYLKGQPEDGISRHITNPLGWRLHRFPARNHKKMLIIDEVAYIGGLNFSEHNFDWHDMMVRIEEPRVVQQLAADFQCTLSGQNQSLCEQVENGRLFFLDGSNSHDLYEQLFEEIASATHSVRIVSPYVSDPLLSRLNKMDDHVQVEIITPATNNKSIMKHYLLAKTRDKKWDIYQYGGGMSHAKAILIDGKKLIVGSSNFDFVSYHLEQEVVWVSEDQALIASFTDKVWQQDLARSTMETERRGGHVGAIFIIFVVGQLMRLLGWMSKKKQ